MCGIVGYIGRKEAVAFLAPALKRLEYRGYDSAGIATVNGQGLEVCKSVGKIAALERRVSERPPHGAIGIAHTRWATHGRPSDTNAHPHTDCGSRLAIVHNGIIENHRDLRRDLTADGHTFRSDTDSEVIAHLIERHRAAGLPEAVRRATEALRGSYAVACISEDQPDMVVAVRSGTSPLVVGSGDEEAFLASDIPALVGTCHEALTLEDGDLAILTRGRVSIERLNGGRVSREVRPLPDDPRVIDKGAYPHFMLKEIYEQPDILARAVGQRVWESGRRVGLQSVGLPDEVLIGIDRVSLLGCGTSRHAAMVGQYLIEQFARMPAEAAIASECRHRTPIYDPAVLAVPISQSGETADTLAALRQATCGHARTLAICNATESSLAREAEGMLDLGAGFEIGVAATKSFTATLASVTWLALKLGLLRGTVSDDDACEVIRAVGRIPALMRQLLEENDENDRIRGLAERFAGIRQCVYLGRGLQYPLALEGALKLKELAYIHAEGCAAGEMKHGPIALVDPGTLVVAVMPTGATIDSMVSSVQEVKARDGVVLALATRGMESISELADEVMWLPPAPACVQPLVVSIPLQLFAYHMASLRGCDVDQPRNLAKSVTVE